MKRQEKTIHGHDYYRYEDNEHWKLAQHNTEAIGVRCGRCGNTSFRLRYGDWEMRAACEECGLEDSVYSG